MEVVRLKFSEAVLSLELAQGFRINKSLALPVDAAKSCEGLELWQGAELFPQLFNVLLLLGRKNEDLLEELLAFWAKHKRLVSNEYKLLIKNGASLSKTKGQQQRTL